MAILVTGVAGFIGYHVARALLDRGEAVIGIDNLTPYYDVRLKQARLAKLEPDAGFRFRAVDIADTAQMEALRPMCREVDCVVHLAAQAGVRHSMVDPHSYVMSNVVGHLNVLELVRHAPGIRHLVYASSSSVYGGNTALPFTETDRVDTPLSLYAATKRADELMSHAYAHLFGVPQTGLRFFTVYGPWGRPDMAYYSFAAAIVAGTPITVYDDGRLRRDFTYIDDIVRGVLGVVDRPPEDGRAPGCARIFNIGNNNSELVSDLIALLEVSLERRAVIRSAPRPAADVVETCASVDAIGALTGFSPRTPLSEGVPRFVDWFRLWQRGLTAGGGR